MGRTQIEDRELQRALGFRQCPQCSYDFATGEGERGCHYYACPYLPDALDVRCPTCLYNFFTGDGNPECGDPPTCSYARDEAPSRVAATRRWLAERGTEPGRTNVPR